MFHALHEALAPAALERLTLVLNHVLAAEPQAVSRLAPWSGSTLRVRPQGWPVWLPPVPALAFRISPAGLLEWVGDLGGDRPDLEVTFDAQYPARLLLSLASGQTPAIQVEGDARLAAEIDWLMTHVRWDIAADMERVLGPGPAQALQAVGAWLVRALNGLRAPGQP